MLSLVMVGVAAGVAAFTITRTKITAGFREWLKVHNKWLNQLFSCPYCLSHWLAAIGVLIYQPRLTERWIVTDLGLSWLAAVAISALTFGLIGSAMRQI